MKAKAKLDNISIKKLQSKGRIICNGCNSKINQMQYVYAIEDKFYHDCCSSNIKGRVKIL
jgi:hypothetical protein